MKKIIVVLVLLLTTILGGCMGIPYIEGGYNYRVGGGPGYTNYHRGGQAPGMYQGARRAVPSYSPGGGYNGTYITP